MANVLDIGSRRELFVDRFLVDRLAGATLKLHPPTPREVAIPFDAPWEGMTSIYVTVLKDSGIYKAYYRGKPDSAPDGGENEMTCYAESADGIHWTKPNLGLVEYLGTRANIIFDGRLSTVTHNFTPMLDTRPGVPAAERYKGLGGLFPAHSDRRHTGGVLAFASPDGIHWRQLGDKAVISLEQHPWPTDTAQNCAFWSEDEGCYVCYMRTWGGPPRPDRPEMRGSIRWIGRTTSPDFIHWSPVEQVDYGDAPAEHLYTNQMQPYVRAPHIVLGFPFRFYPQRKAVPEHPAPGVSDGVLISSRGGNRVDRTFLEAFLRPGRDRHNWTDRNMSIAVGVHQTGPDELSLYWTENYRHATCRLRRGTVRLDGFASVNAGYVGGELVTHPLRFDGAQLLINYATSAAGSVRVELQDAAGAPLPGYTLADSAEMYGDEIERAVTWQGKADVRPLAGQPVRLRFVLKDADVFALRFAP